MTDFRETRTSQHEEGRTQRIATFKATQLIWLFLGIIEAIIALRFIFRLVGVYADNNFASFIYGLSNFFVAPFLSLTGAPASGNMVFEPTCRTQFTANDQNPNTKRYTTDFCN
jgi:hypothetical protein